MKKKDETVEITEAWWQFAMRRKMQDCGGALVDVEINEPTRRHEFQVRMNWDGTWEFV
jgi:hypothetical protein